MVDLRLPLAQARERGLWPDLVPIREYMKDAAVWLNGEFFEENPRFLTPHTHADLAEAQRALAGVCRIDEFIPPWERLDLLLSRMSSMPWILWSGREVGIGKTGEFIEHLVRLADGDADAMVACYRARPSVSLPEAYQKKKSRWFPWTNYLPWDKLRGQSVDWWHSEEGRADFNARVFEFALRRLPELIASDE